MSSRKEILRAKETGAQLLVSEASCSSFLKSIQRFFEEVSVSQSPLIKGRQIESCLSQADAFCFLFDILL